MFKKCNYMIPTWPEFDLKTPRIGCLLPRCQVVDRRRPWPQRPFFPHNMASSMRHWVYIIPHPMGKVSPDRKLQTNPGFLSLLPVVTVTTFTGCPNAMSTSQGRLHHAEAQAGTRQIGRRPAGFATKKHSASNSDEKVPMRPQTIWKKTP